jgi:hypothetical protein
MRWPGQGQEHESVRCDSPEEVARQIDDLTDELAGETGQSDSYLARVGQLVQPLTSP